MKIKHALLPGLIILSIILGIVLIGNPSRFFVRKNPLPQTVSEKPENIIPPESSKPDVAQKKENNATTSVSNFSGEDIKEYYGPVRHVFFHSLIVYPQMALADTGNTNGYRDNMLTVEQFKQVLQQLYENHFLLIDAKLLYSFNKNGSIRQNKLYLPKDKKPLILSIDDLSYYSYMKNGGFAHKLILENGIVETEILTPKGNKIITDDGDVVPIVDAFIKEHPDFSLNGAKGIIGLTGFEGILGYRTQWRGKQGDVERKNAALVADALKKSGWTFACHSFGHEQNFLKGTASLAFLRSDISLWTSQVQPLVGPTNVFIGPFGQVFTDGEARRKLLIDAGFNILYGVGMDGYIKYFGNYLVMNRIDIDGYRLKHNAKKLYDFFGLSVDANF